jgi:hypothetical protein
MPGARVLGDVVSSTAAINPPANGWLTLSGRLKHQYESNAAFEAVARLPHVGGITNKIQVVTAGGC